MKTSSRWLFAGLLAAAIGFTGCRSYDTDMQEGRGEVGREDVEGVGGAGPVESTAPESDDQGLNYEESKNYEEPGTGGSGAAEVERTLEDHQRLHGDEGTGGSGGSEGVDGAEGAEGSDEEGLRKIHGDEATGGSGSPERYELEHPKE